MYGWSAFERSPAPRIGCGVDTGLREQNAENALARIRCEQDRDAVVNLIIETEKRLQMLDGPRSRLLGQWL